MPTEGTQQDVQVGYRKLEKAASHHLNSRFAHDVTKIQTKELLILLRVNVLIEVWPHHNIFIYRNFQFERVIRFAIKDAWIF